MCSSLVKDVARKLKCRWMNLTRFTCARCFDRALYVVVSLRACAFQLFSAIRAVAIWEVPCHEGSEKMTPYAKEQL